MKRLDFPAFQQFLAFNSGGTDRMNFNITAFLLRYLLPLTAFLGCVFFISDRASAAATLTVCPSGCDHSTIQGAVNSASHGDTIQLLTTLPHTEFDIVVNKSVTIEGLGETTSTVQADATPGTAPSRVFYLLNGLTVHIREMTIRYGDTLGDGGGIFNEGSDLTLTNVRIHDNEADGDGGGIYHEAGLLTLNNIWIFNNSRSRNGSGLYNGATLVMNDSDIFSNNGADRGGGIYNIGIATIRNSTIGANTADDFSGFNLQGGGIFNSGTLTLIESSVSGNSVEFNAGLSSGGGGIYSTGDLNIYHSVVSLNETSAFNSGHGISIGGGNAWIANSIIDRNGTITTGPVGGGLYMIGGAVTVVDTTVSGNLGAFGAGIMFNTGTLDIRGSTIEGNSGVNGAGLAICGPGVSLSNVTISGNDAATDGGGVYLCESGEVTLANVTISENIADADADDIGNGGGLYLQTANNLTGTANLRNTIVAGNQDLTGFPAPQATDCFGELDSDGHNLIRSLGFALDGPPCSISGATTGNLIGEDAMLAALADNGGPTWTHALLGGSPGINAGNPAGCLDYDNILLDRDQRGGLRLDRCDMGAFEMGALVETLFLPTVRK